MHQEVVELFQLLIQAGAVPGEDFSCDAEQQAYHLNERCYTLLQEAFPEVDWRDVLGAPHAAVSARITNLHQHLGHPFVDQLIPLMVRRLASLPNTEAAGYVRAVLAGVESATGITLFPFLHQALDLSGQARLEWLLRQSVLAIPGDDCLADLLQASGATAQDYEWRAGEIWLTEAGWQRLSAVWDGECTLGESVQRSPKNL